MNIQKHKLCVAVGEHLMERKSGIGRDEDHGCDAAAIKANLDRIASEAGTRLNAFGERLQDCEQKLAKRLNCASAADGAATFNFSAITDSDGFRRFQAKTVDRTEHFQLDMRLKALVNLTGEVNTAGGTFPTPFDRAPGVHGFALRRLRLLDVLLARPVSTNITEFVQLHSDGEADVQDDEGAEKAEMDFEGELQKANVATIAVHTTTSAQVLDDNDGLQAELQRIMGHSVLSKIEQQLVVGSGMTGRVNGLYTQATAITTTANAIPDRLGQAVTEMDTAGYPCNLILMHPNDWFAISIMKDNERRYLYGNPASPAQPSLWNLPVVTTPSLPQGTALVGDTQQVRVLDRMAPTVFLSRDHMGYRTKNLVLVLVEARAGLELYDVLAFRKVDLSATT